MRISTCEEQIGAPIADAEHVADPGIEARGWHDGAGYTQFPADVFFIVDGSWGDFQEPDQH